MYVALSRARSLEGEVKSVSDIDGLYANVSEGLKVIKLPDAKDRGRNREVAEFLWKHFGGRPVSKATAAPASEQDPFVTVARCSSAARALLSRSTM